MKRLVFVPLLAVVALLSCSKERIGGTVPEITNLGQSAQTINILPGSEDSLAFQFSFKDGDADIQGGQAKVVFKNILDTAAQPVEYPFPEIQAELDPSLGASGRVIIQLDATALLFQITDTARKRALQRYEVYMADDAGNKSNILTSQDVEVVNEP